MRAGVWLDERLQRLRRDSVARDTLWAGGLEALQLGSMLLSFALLGTQLGPSGFGAYAAVYALIGILGGFVYAGVSLTTVQRIVRDGEDLSKVLNSALGLVLVTGLCGTVLGTTVGQVTVPSVALGALVCLMVAELLGTAWIDVMSSVVWARDGLAAAAKFRGVPIVGKVVVLLALYAGGNLTIMNLAVTYLVLYLVISMAIAIAIGRRYGVAVRLGRPRWSHVGISGLYSMTTSSLAVQSDADKIVMSAARLGPDVGLYAAAYRFVMMGMVPLRALLTASHRRFLEHDPSSRGQHVRLSLRFSIIGVAYGVLFGIVMYIAAPLVTVVLGPEYEGATTMLRWLAPVVAVRSVADFGMNGLLGFGRVGVRTSVASTAAAAAIVLYVVLIPSMGWQGAVLGTYISELILGLLAWSALLYYQRQHDAGLDGDIGSASSRSTATLS